jgi:hypothetical protein
VTYGGSLCSLSKHLMVMNTSKYFNSLQQRRHLEDFLTLYDIYKLTQHCYEYEEFSCWA